MGLLSRKFDDRAGFRRAHHFPYLRRLRLGHQTQNTPVPTSCSARYASAMRCLRCPAVQKITGTRLAAPHALTRRRPAIRNQMGVVQLCVAVAVQPAPPGAQTARGDTQRVERVKHVRSQHSDSRRSQDPNTAG